MITIYFIFCAFCVAYLLYSFIECQRDLNRIDALYDKLECLLEEYETAERDRQKQIERQCKRLYRRINAI